MQVGHLNISDAVGICLWKLNVFLTQGQNIKPFVVRNDDQQWFEVEVIGDNQSLCKTAG